MPDGQDPPDIYTDQVGMVITEWGFIFLLNTISPTISQETTALGETEGFRQNVTLPAELRGTVRMSHAHAKTLAILMKRALKLFEEQSGEIRLPNQVVAKHKITDEDWT